MKDVAEIARITYPPYWGQDPNVSWGYRLCHFCFDRGVKVRATHYLIYRRRWWCLLTGRSAGDAVCDTCALNAAAYDQLLTTNRG